MSNDRPTRLIGQPLEGMPMNNLATAGNFFLFMEVLEKFRVVYGTFWIELFLACHRTFGIFLIRARIQE